MKYIAQVTIDKAVAAIRGLHGLYEWHQEAWKMFPGRPRDKRNSDFHFLTRLDTDEHEFRFTIVSDIKPQKQDWYPAGGYKEMEIPVFFFGRKSYLFQLTANPTRTLSGRGPKGNKKKRGSHYAILKQDELRHWFQQKEKQCGFHVLEEPVLEISKPVFHKLYKGDDEGIVVGVEFKGALEVTNKELFEKTMREGIGRARGFGFGLFVLKPLV